MDIPISQKSRSSNDIIAELETLTQEEGFVYTFCSLVLRSLRVPTDEVSDINWSEQPNRRELSFLLGLMVKHPLKITEVPSAQESKYQFEAAYDLLEELHRILTFRGNWNALDVLSDFESWSTSGERMVEPIFYSGDGAYGFQYLEMAARRYAGDKEWLRNHSGISLRTVIDIAIQLEQRINDGLKLIRTSWSSEEFLTHCLSAFSFGPDDIEGFDDESIRCFFEAFSLIPGTVNAGFSSVGEYNAADSHPLVCLESERYFSPIFFNLTQSIYESPFYWMMGDPAYKEVGLENRGSATEYIALEQLIRVFGTEQVFKGVQVKRNGQDVTDIDVLAFAGNKVLVVQAKSKKLTEMSKRGDEESLRRDFKQAVQEAYEQGLLSRKAVLERDTSLYDNCGREIQLPEAIDDAYIICLTGDDYPALTIQVDTFLQKSSDDPFPIAMSLFDLDILTFYLEDPYDLLYYIRQRSTLSMKLKADSEMAMLGFHLKEKLFLPEGCDVLMIDPTYAQLIDANFPVAQGHQGYTDAADRLFHQWKNPVFDQIVHEVKMIGRAGFTDALFLLYDSAGKGADNITSAIEGRRKLTAFDRRRHDASVLVANENKGVTFMSFPRWTNTVEAQFEAFVEVRKHAAKADEWLAFGSVASSSKAFDMMWYSKQPWCSDAILDEHAKVLLKHGSFRRSDGSKVGRNAPCPCGSGRKYKKCHLELKRLSSGTRL